MAWRYLAQQALTGDMLDLDLPLTRDELRWDLSGPGSLRGTLPAEWARVNFPNGAPALGEWSTYLYAEESGRIRWGGILQRSVYGGPGLWSLEAAGFVSYADRMNYTGSYYKRTAYDPTLIFQAIWTHLQTQPDGNLGLTVVLPGNCPVRIGTAAEPYELAWWESTDCGSELGQLALETPFDFTEEHAWSGSTITHKLNVSYPRVGRQRDDLVFNQDNIREAVEVQRDGSPDSFANVAYVIGKGEGAATIQGYDGVRDGRLRRMTTYTDKLAGTTARANSLARRQRLTKALEPQLASITVNDHDNARIGSWQAGDDIRVEVTLPTLGKVDMWHRVTAWSLLTDTSATLQLARSSTFHYGSVAS